MGTTKTSELKSYLLCLASHGGRNLRKLALYRLQHLGKNRRKENVLLLARCRTCSSTSAHFFINHLQNGKSVSDPEKKKKIRSDRKSNLIGSDFPKKKFLETFRDFLEVSVSVQFRIGQNNLESSLLKRMLEIVFVGSMKKTRLRKSQANLKKPQ